MSSLSRTIPSAGPAGAAPKLGELLERATGPDREIDARLWCYLNGKRYFGHCRAWGDDRLTQVEFTEPPKRTRRVTLGKALPHAEPWSASLDAVLALVEEKLPVQLWRVWQSNPDEYAADIGDEDTAFAPTPALALLKALVSALSGEAPTLSPNEVSAGNPATDEQINQHPTEGA